MQWGTVSNDREESSSVADPDPYYFGQPDPDPL